MIENMAQLGTFSLQNIMIPAAHGFSALIAGTLTRMPALEKLAVVGLQRRFPALSSTSMHAP